MHRHAQHVSERQIPFDFPPMDHAARQSALRAAYVRSELSRYLSFEQAMSTPAYAISIRNLADALAHRDASSHFDTKTGGH